MRVAGELSFQLTEADYVAANRAWFMRTMSKPNVLKAPALAAIFAFTIGFAMTRFIDRAPLAAQIEVGLILAGLALLLIAVLYEMSFLVLPYRARKLFRQQTSMHKPLRFAWSPEGFVQGSAHGEGKYLWTDLHRWSDGATAILLYHTEAMYFVVPRRALSDDQHRDVVATLEHSGLARF